MRPIRHPHREGHEPRRSRSSSADTVGKTPEMLFFDLAAVAGTGTTTRWPASEPCTLLEELTLYPAWIFRSSGGLPRRWMPPVIP